MCVNISRYLCMYVLVIVCVCVCVFVRLLARFLFSVLMGLPSSNLILSLYLVDGVHAHSLSGGVVCQDDIRNELYTTYAMGLTSLRIPLSSPSIASITCREKRAINVRDCYQGVSPP